MVARSKKFINRELSWLAFNQRVLDEAKSPEVPLLERLRFLAITASNLDEFFRVRVGGLQILTEQASVNRDPSGMTPGEQLSAIDGRVHKMVEDQYHCFLDQLEPEMDEQGITRVGVDALTEEQRRTLATVFEHELFPLLTPVAVESASKLPPLSSGMLHVCVRLKPAGEGTRPRFAIIPLGKSLNRFIHLGDSSSYQYMLLEDVVSVFSSLLFVGEEIRECVPFRVTRNADMAVREDLASDLLDEMAEVLDARKRSPIIRLEVSEEASQTTLSFLQRAMKLEDDEIYTVLGPLDLAAYFEMADQAGFDQLRYESWSPQASPEVDPTQGLFDQVRRKDILLHHPYESFEPVVRFIEEAAADPDVLAIKQVLYRTSKKSPVVAALERAALAGKAVTAIVELKARFDEARNIGWAKRLERAGVQVIYGVKGLKTHAKIALVVRREAGGIQRYMHFGTGNYNERTARLYGDIGLMTCNPELGMDASNFFNAVTGYSQPQQFEKISVAPLSLKDRILELIRYETERKRQGDKAAIVAKMNSLVHPEVVGALYEASKAGVPIDLNIRGICCLVPGRPGLSETITVTSIVDRFLEHARILYFYHGGDELVFLSSADWMQRNLDRRVELLVPVEDKACRSKLIEALKVFDSDNVKAQVLAADGSYRRAERKPRQRALRAQQVLYDRACQAAEQQLRDQSTYFEPHRPSGSKGS